LISKPVSSQLN